MRKSVRCVPALRAVIVAAAVLTASTALAQDWAGLGRAQGRVTDEHGDPVEGATVSLRLPDSPEQGPDVLITDSKGKWSYLGLKGGLWTVIIEADGYVTSQGTLDVDEFQRTPVVKVQLQRDPYAFIDEGEALLDAGDPGAARACFEQGLEGLEAQYRPQLRALIGDTYYQEGDFETALATYQQALSGLEAEDAVAVRIKLADAHMQLGDPAAARSQYQQTLPFLLPEGQSQVTLAIARSYDEAGERDEALATLEGLLAQQPENPQALQLMADLLSRAGREQEAQAYIDRIPETSELPADMLLNVGIRQYNQGEYDQAMENFERAVRENPDLADVYYYRGLVLLGRGENDGARADLERFLELAPEGEQAVEAREFLRHLSAGEHPEQ